MYNVPAIKAVSLVFHEAAIGLSSRNVAAVEIGKDFILSQGYIRNDFDVKNWTAPEFPSCAPYVPTNGASGKDLHSFQGFPS